MTTFWWLLLAALIIVVAMSILVLSLCGVSADADCRSYAPTFNDDLGLFEEDDNDIG